ncbi:hypothetical protein C8034_v008445 [Colletotrichum sidae]|uniref:Alpha-L-rhamnosidase six-hairpin glycosidase domain-containing protein n=1 Tax=Colletotrichum sidae TaxID=1347389 RepID=A0A4R8T2E4_9PEZI|nr:hypothetical protein C8034_v008445 [Colletotrichum sidae]
MAVPDAFSYDRDEIAHSLAAYYSVLARACYFSPQDIQSPPTEGWSDLELDVDALRALRRSDKVIDLLRHIPYIKPCKSGDEPVQWPVLVRSRAIRYLRDDGDFSDWSARGGEGLAELANAPLDHTPAGPMDLPPDVVVLSRGYDSSEFGSPWCIIDCETGIMTPYTSGTGPTDKPWQTSRCSARLFFNEMTSFLKSKTIIALPPVGHLEPEIMGSESDQNVDVRHKLQCIYQVRGWATFEEDPSSWRREECIEALKTLRNQLWEAEKKRPAHEADFDDPEDEDFEDPDSDAGSAASQSETASEDVDAALEDDDKPVHVSEKELAEVWADLDETEYMMIDRELKGEGIRHAFHPTKAPQRLARAPPSSEDNGPGASQVLDQTTRCNDSIEMVAGAIKSHYLALSRAAYFPPSMVETAPDSGWSDHVFPAEELEMLGYSDKAVSLLRHLPYLAFDEHFWEVLPGSRPIRYLRDAEVSEPVPRDKLRRDSLQRLGLSPYDEAMPADVVALSSPAQDSWRGTWWMIDAGRGVIFCESGPKTQMEAPASSRGPESIVAYFDKLASKIRGLEIVPMPGLGPDENHDPVIWAEPSWERGADVDALADMSEADRRIVLPAKPGLGLEFAPFTLTPDIPVATLDYGAERAGFPFLDVSALDAPAQIEVKYTEHFDGLHHPFGDGPYTFSNQLGNSFRVETFNISSTGRLASPLIQGGQRWQSIRLLTNASVSFASVGFEATIDTAEPEDLPGQFHSDDDELNEIWKLGARAATAACVDKGTQRAIWEVDEDNGVFARSVRPSLTWKATAWANYTIEFDTKIQRGGSWWATGASVAGNGYILLLTGELPEGSTFVNANKTLTPPNSLSLAYGPDFVNQTTLTSFHLGSFPVPFTVKEDVWYHVATAMSPSGRLTVSINNTQILDISRADYPWALLAGTAYSGSPAFTGSFGFGAYQDHAAYFRNARALVWLGDFYHTARVVAASTSRTGRARGTLQYLLDSQIANGQMNTSPNLGYDLLLGLMAFNDHVKLTNDVVWARETWSRWRRVVDWLLPQINATTGLLTFEGGFAFTGPADGGSAIGCEAVQALKGAADVAAVLDDAASARRYRDAAEGLAAAINDRLWNEETGAYGLALASMDDTSVAATAFCITSGVAGANRTARSIEALTRLKLGPGYKDSSQVASDDPSVNISPNTNGVPAARDKSAVGASWEYVNAATGRPGLGLFTSLSHPWGGAATYVLTERAAGVRAAEGVDGFGATVVTAFGGSLSAEWEVEGADVYVTIRAPAGTRGRFVYGGRSIELHGREVYEFHVDSALEAGIV